MVLCSAPVIGEHAPDILHEADEPYVGDEDGHAHDTIEDVPGNRVHVRLTEHEVAQRCGQDDEDCDAENDTDEHRDGHEDARTSGLLLRLAVLGELVLFLVPIVSMLTRDTERFVTKRQGFHEGGAATDNGPVHPGVLLAPGSQIVFLGVDLTIWLADGNRPIVATAHHDALDERLPTDMRPRLDVAIRS